MGILIRKEFLFDRKIFLASFVLGAYNEFRQKKYPEPDKFGVVQPTLALKVI
jgi:hypothetical protein